VLGFLTVFGGCATHVHVDGHRLQHTVVYAVELLYLLGHAARLVVHLVDVAYLRTKALEMHLIDGVDGGKVTAEALDFVGAGLELCRLVGNVLE
jgi:hypothetical protein